MHEIADANLPIMKRSVNTDEAIALFHKHHMYDKERLFNYRRVSRVNLYSIESFEDYFYGCRKERTESGIPGTDCFLRWSEESLCYSVERISDSGIIHYLEFI